MVFCPVCHSLNRSQKKIFAVQVILFSLTGMVFEEGIDFYLGTRLQNDVKWSANQSLDGDDQTVHFVLIQKGLREIFEN